MSNRCLISLKKYVREEDSLFDYIYDEDGNADGLSKEWLYAGPLKLKIRSAELYPQFLKDMKKNGYNQEFMFSYVQIYIEGYVPQTLQELNKMMKNEIERSKENEEFLKKMNAKQSMK